VSEKTQTHVIIFGLKLTSLKTFLIATTAAAAITTTTTAMCIQSLYTYLGFYKRSSFLYAHVFISCNRDWHLGLDFSAKLVADKEAKEAPRNPVADHSRCSESMVAFLPDAPPSVDMNVVAEGIVVVFAAVEDCGNKSAILVVDGDEQ
jgi:hypothetical protein